MQKCQTIVHAEHILTQDAQRTHLKHSSIAIDQGRIVGMGPRQEILAAWQGQTEKDLSNVLIIPGLVNAHSHAAMTFLRGFADDMPLMDWLNQCIFPLEQHLSPEIAYWGALLGYAEMIRTGTTACMDMYLLMGDCLRAADTAGLRCVGSQVVFSFPAPRCPDYQSALAQTRELARHYARHSRVRLCVSPHAVYTTTPTILSACRDVAEELHLPLHMHLAESAAESADCLARQGKRPLPYCAELGLLGPNTTLAHVVDAQPEELDMLARSGATVAHNPSSNMKLASGIAPVPAMRERGIAVALGTDGAASNNRLNMFTEMSRAALLHKVHSGNPTSLPAQEVLDMATLGGASALHDSRLGKLELGGPADMVALDLLAPNMQPLYEPASQLVYAATGMEVRMTMVEGEILYEDGIMTRFDYPGLLQEMAGIARWVRSHKK